MNTTKKGDILEILVAALETAAFSNPNTKVYPNYRLPDSNGIKRDIDVYFETTINKKKFRYGIECKNYGPNSPVKIDHIVGLFGKIDRTGVIGIIVTTGKVQANAIKKAKSYGIEIYQIQPNNTHLLNQSDLVIKRREIKSFKFFSKELFVAENMKLIEIKNLFYGSKKEELKASSFIEGLNESLIRKTSQNNELFFKDLYSIIEKDKEIIIKINKRVSKIFDIPINDFFLQFKNKYYGINNLAIELDFWIERSSNKDLNGQKYKSLTEDVTFSKFLTHDFSYMGKNLIWNTIIDEETGNHKNIITNSQKKGEIFPAEFIGNIKSEWKVSFVE